MILLPTTSLNCVSSHSVLLRRERADNLQATRGIVVSMCSTDILMHHVNIKDFGAVMEKEAFRLWDSGSQST